MKEHPILFSTEMVKAILVGNKTQTRRVMKSQPTRGVICKCPGDDSTFNNFEMYYCEREKEGWIPLGDGFKCPYGKVGDRLWVKETFCHFGNCYNAGKWQAYVKYKADGQADIEFGENEPPKEKWWNTGKRLDYWQPSIFMPRWASRITLEITGERVAQVQDISEADAQAEGAPGIATHKPYPRQYRDSFEALWGSINLKRGYSWASNPWCWVIEFKRIDP